MWGLLDPKILVPGQPRGIGDPGREQGKREVIAPVDGQIGDVLLRDSVRLAASFRFDHRRLVRDLHDRCHVRRFQSKVGRYRLPDGDSHVSSNLGRKPRHLRTDIVSGRRQPYDTELTRTTCHGRALQAGLGLDHLDRNVWQNRAGRVRYRPGDLSR